jgi:hypothetical protein
MQKQREQLVVGAPFALSLDTRDRSRRAPASCSTTDQMFCCTREIVTAVPEQPKDQGRAGCGDTADLRRDAAEPLACLRNTRGVGEIGADIGMDQHRFLSL